RRRRPERFPPAGSPAAASEGSRPDLVGHERGERLPVGLGEPPSPPRRRADLIRRRRACDDGRDLGPRRERTDGELEERVPPVLGERLELLHPRGPLGRPGLWTVLEPASRRRRQTAAVLPREDAAREREV